LASKSARNWRARCSATAAIQVLELTATIQSNPAHIKAHKPKQSFASMKVAKKKPLMQSDVAAILKAMQTLSEQDEWVISCACIIGAAAAK
jgi:hypothetical protein